MMSRLIRIAGLAILAIAIAAQPAPAPPKAAPTPAQLVEAGEKAAEAGNYAKAERAFRAAIARKGYTERAAADLALEHWSTSRILLTVKGDAHEALGQIAEARAAFERTHSRRS